MKLEFHSFGMATIAILSIAVLFPVTAYAWSEPDGFAGLKFGEDLTKQLPECKKQMRSEGTRCYQKGHGIYKLGTYELYNMGEIQKYLIELTADQSESKLYKVSSVFESSNAWRLLQILNYRYGKPAIQDEQVRDGVRLNNTIALWKGSKVSIVYESRVPEIKRGMITWFIPGQGPVNEAIKKGSRGL